MSQTENTEDVKEVKATETEQRTETEQVEEKEPMVTRAEAQKMADAMVAKKLKGMPSKEELAEYKKWKDDQKTAEEKRAEQEEKYRKIEAENLTLKQERTILDKGVKAKDVDYVAYKVNKMEGDFGENLEAFLKENPEFLNATPSKVATDGKPVSRGSEPEKSSVTEILKKRNPEANL